MSFLSQIKRLIGDEMFLLFDEEAKREVALAKKMPLKNEFGDKRYYEPRFLLGQFRDECALFGGKRLEILPTEIVDLLFRCRLLFAVDTKDEFAQRCGGGPMNYAAPTVIRWDDRSGRLDALIERNFQILEGDIRERTLITPLHSFMPDTSGSAGRIQDFFDALFHSIDAPFEAFIAADRLVEKHKSLEPYWPDPGPTSAGRHFQVPSIGFKVRGSTGYCFWSGVFSLRSFLNLLRIAGFIHPGQMDFGMFDGNVKMIPPTYPVFVGTHSEGSFQWREDTKEAWQKLPDGALFRSFGYRGICPMWLDQRTFGPLTKLVRDHEVIFALLKTPWTGAHFDDLAPTLDLLSTAVQMPDLGAKILLFYTCLEHLFVPRGTRNNQRMFILGGLKALKPSLVPWFENLYTLRCDYAHRGFVTVDDKTRHLTREAAENILGILTTKLSVVS